MLENYKQHENGVIEQVNRKPFNYGYDYSANYNGLGELGVRMGYLRLGHIIGSLGFIPDSIMDIGYGNGDFLKVCTTSIRKCYGSDVSSYPVPEHVERVEDRYSVEVEVATMYDVLEHHEDIYEIQNLKAKYLVISVPFCHNFDDQWFEEWKHRKPDEHIWHFNEQSLKNFMTEIGYTCINMTNVEDTIRKNGKDYANILTGVFVRK